MNFSFYFFYHPFNILHYFIVPKSNNSNVFTAQISLPLLIMNSFGRVLTPIDFNRKTDRGAIEI